MRSFAGHFGMVFTEERNGNVSEKESRATKPFTSSCFVSASFHGSFRTSFDDKIIGARAGVRMAGEAL